MDNGCQLCKSVWKVKSRNITIAQLVTMNDGIYDCLYLVAKIPQAGVWKTTEGILTKEGKQSRQ